MHHNFAVKSSLPLTFRETNREKEGVLWSYNIHFKFL